MTGPFDPDAPGGDLHLLYHQLTALLGEVIEALAEGLGDDEREPGSP